MALRTGALSVIVLRVLRRERSLWRIKKFVLTVPVQNTELLSVQAKQDAISAQGNSTPPSVLINNARERALFLLLMQIKLFIQLW